MYGSEDGYDVLYVNFINDTIPPYEPTMILGNAN